MSRHRIASVSDVPAGRGREYRIGGVILTLWNVEEAFYATDARCPHEDAPLCMGVVEDGVVTCPMHGWQFNVTTGEGVKPPHIQLRTFPVTVDGDDVYVEV